MLEAMHLCLTLYRQQCKLHRQGKIVCHQVVCQCIYMIVGLLSRVIAEGKRVITACDGCKRAKTKVSGEHIQRSSFLSDDYIVRRHTALQSVSGTQHVLQVQPKLVE